MPSADVTTVMITALFLSVGLNTLVKANLSSGMSNFVFVAYSNLFGFCFLLTATTLRYRSRSPPPLNNSIVFRAFLIGFLGMEKLDLKLRSCQAKTIGTVVSIAGALTVTLYKGLPITSDEMRNNIFLSSQSQWLLGGCILSTATFTASLLIVIQVNTFNYTFKL
ncbi:hypothetical protein V8G54_017036 [Vigna mungo]|uniref:WAT1-related protein n=1 Tax=Vigna mungo TaxID=3915 RepID=A0AAQ3NMA1_VIGMU